MGKFNQLLKSHREFQEINGEDTPVIAERSNGNGRKKSEGRFFVHRSRIVRDPGQVRKYFDPEKLESLSQTILEEGILEDLGVFELPDQTGYYQLIFGERRFRASEIAGLEELPIRVLEKPDAKRLLKIQLIENKHHEDLNPIEEVEAVLELLAEEIKHSQEQVITLLKQMDNDARRSSYNVIGQPECEKIIQILTSLNIKWRSFVLNQLQLLKLPTDILDPIRKGQIEYTKALAIARVKEDRKRKKLLKDVISNDLSIREIREHVKNLNHVEISELGELEVRQRWMEVAKLINKSDVWNDAKKQKKIENLISQLESLIKA
jgi:ParB family transcriptional regulator, chromosome partitioning protein